MSRIDQKNIFSEYAEYVVDLKERAGLKPKTAELYRRLLERIDQAIGHLKLAEIRPQHLNALYKNLSEEGIRRGGSRATSKYDIYKWMEIKRLSITQFARTAGVSATTLSTAADGKSVSLKTAKAIASAMGLPVEQLFNVENNTAPLSNKTVLEHHRLISAILAQAEKELLVPFNAAAKATPPKVERKTPDYYQPEIVHTILDALEAAPLKWKLATYLLIDTGCRRGEVMGLKWQDVDLNEGIINVKRALLYVTGKGVYEGPTKTDRERVLRIAPETLDLLKRWKDEQARMCSSYGDSWVETGYVFTRDNGDRMHPDSLTDWLNRFSRENDLPHIHPHAFRHTAASTMIANGIDIATVAGELGHSTPTTTMSVYTHMIAAAKAKAENVRAGIFKRNNQG